MTLGDHHFHDHDNRHCHDDDDDDDDDDPPQRKVGAKRQRCGA